MHQVEATLYDRRTGYTAKFQTKYPDTHDDGLILFHWQEGNYYCDCNRSLFLYDDESQELECGHEHIALLELTVDGGRVMGFSPEPISLKS